MALSVAVIKTSLADLVYQRILDAIRTGQLEAGSPLNVSDLAGDLKVSASPVRDALQRLSAEGLVRINSNRRATVVSFTRDEVREIFQVREILECGAAASAAESIDDRRVAAIREAAKRCGALAGDPAQKKKMLELDDKFHFLIAEASGNGLLREEIIRTNRRARVMQLLKVAPPRMVRVHGEHEAIVRALGRRDPDAVRKAMGEHIRVALDLVLAGM